jgi:recombination associated protein RdgC
MDMVDLIKDKAFWGQEFLTWLWYVTDVNNGLVDCPGYGTVEIWLENRLVLQSGSGNARQTVTCQGKDLDLEEARTALREGKKVSQMRLRLAAEAKEWRLSLKAEGLELGSVRPPETLDMDEEEAGSLAGRLLDRVAVFQELSKILDVLFSRFLAIRLTDAWDAEERPRIRRWLNPAD